MLTKWIYCSRSYSLIISTQSSDTTAHSYNNSRHWIKNKIWHTNTAWRKFAMVPNDLWTEYFFFQFLFGGIRSTAWIAFKNGNRALLCYYYSCSFARERERATDKSKIIFYKLLARLKYYLNGKCYELLGKFMYTV